MIQYLHATGDLEYGRTRIRPVLDQVCRWIESRVTQTPRGYEILGANGIAEKQHPVDNNAFVNMAASVVLRETLALAPELGSSPARAGRRSAVASTCRSIGARRQSRITTATGQPRKREQRLKRSPGCFRTRMTRTPESSRRATPSTSTSPTGT